MCSLQHVSLISFKETEQFCAKHLLLRLISSIRLADFFTWLDELRWRDLQFCVDLARQVLIQQRSQLHVLLPRMFHRPE